MNANTIRFVCSLTLLACGGPAPVGPGVSPGGGGAAGPAFETLTVNWRVVRADGTPDTCDPVFDQVKVMLSNGSGPGWSAKAMRSPRAELADCRAGSTRIQVQIAGDGAPRPATPYFSATLAIIDGSYSPTLSGFFPTESQLADLSKGPVSLNFDIHPNAGFLATMWTLKGVRVREHISCSTAGVARLAVTYTRVTLNDGSPADLKSTTRTFSCSSEPGSQAILDPYHSGIVGGGISPALDNGRYQIRFEALSAAGVVVGQYVTNEADSDIAGTWNLPFDSEEVVRAFMSARNVEVPVSTH